MHGILRDTAAKLLCAEAIMSARSVSASSGRWHRQLEVTGARLLTGGMRSAASLDILPPLYVFVL